MIKLFTNIAQFNTYMPVDVNATDERVGAYIDFAAQEYLIPILGQAQYDDIYTKWKNNTIVANSADDVLLGRIRGAIAPLAYYEGLATNGINLGDNGATITVTETTRPVFQWQMRKLERSLLRHGFTAVESMFLYLKATASNSLLTYWYGSEERTYLLGLLLNTSVEFNRFYNIDGRRTLWAMRNNIKAVQESVIAANVTDAVFTNLVTANNGSPTATESALLVMIKRVIAYKSVEKSLKERVVTLNEYGVTVESLTGETDAQVMAANEDRIMLQLRHLQNEGEYWLGRVRRYLNEHATASIFADYYNSTLYNADTSKNKIDNSTGGFFAGGL